MDRKKLLKETKKDLDNYMKVYPVILKIDGNAARKIKTELESRYNFQARRLEEAEKAEAKKKEQEALQEMVEATAKKAADESPEARLERLEKALEKLGISV